MSVKTDSRQSCLAEHEFTGPFSDTDKDHFWKAEFEPESTCANAS